MKEQPNCELCKWKKSEEIKSIFSVFGTDVSLLSKCAAQGNRYSTVVYGNKNCEKLFEEKKNESHK